MIHDHKNLASFADDAAHHRPTEVTTLAYFLNPQPRNVLVIGVGGGVDVAEARSFGAQAIDGAEINPATIALVTRQFRDYAEWPKWNNIRIYHAEGRHFVRDSAKHYDVIVMHGVDTFAALSSGAYVLSENYLYTVEVFGGYLNVLMSDGVMVIYRLVLLQPRESLRLANLFVEAAQHTGVGRPEERIMVINDGRWAGTFIKRQPFTKREVDALAEVVNRAGYSWIFVPKVLGSDQQAFEQVALERQHARLQIARVAFASLITAKTATERATFVRNYPYRIDPVYDNRPFFFEYDKGKVSDSQEQNWGPLEDSSRVDLTALRGPVVHSVLFVLLMATTVACLAGMGIPLLTFERDGARVDGALGLIGFFSSLGLGFMFVEIG
jgi:spermidine synthase